tara:strand:+ start:312 stop:1343 length:1032 start_codon:yes stop_codon:yes gene_type:complete
MENEHTIEDSVEVNEESSVADSVADFISTKYARKQAMEEFKADTNVLNEKPDVYDAEGKTDGGTLVRGTSGEQEVEDKTSGKDKKNKATIAGKAKAGKVETIQKTSEHLEAIFNGEDLSEDFMSKTATIFESAINERVNAINESLQEEYETQLQESTQEILKDLSEKLDDYLNYVVEEWMKDNELSVERGIKTEISENFITGLKELFENNYIDVPDSKYDLLDGLFESNEELEGRLNKEIEKNISLNKSIESYQCGHIFTESTAGLADTEVEKLQVLAEGIDFEDITQYKQKLSVLRESYFNDGGFITESDESSEPSQQAVNPETPMGGYMDAISRISKATNI